MTQEGLSVPGSISLEKMSEIFEVSIENLLDSTEDVNAKLNQKDILEQLAIFNEQNAEKQRTKNCIKKDAGDSFIIFYFGFLVYNVKNHGNSC